MKSKEPKINTPKNTIYFLLATLWILSVTGCLVTTTGSSPWGISNAGDNSSASQEPTGSIEEQVQSYAPKLSEFTRTIPSAAEDAPSKLSAALENMKKGTKPEIEIKYFCNKGNDLRFFRGKLVRDRIHQQTVDFLETCQQVCDRLQRWRPNGVSVDPNAKLAAITFQALLAISQKEPPFRCQSGGTNCFGVPQCLMFREKILTAAPTCVSFDCLRLLVAAAAAEEKCMPLAEEARQRSASRDWQNTVGIWFQDFTSFIYAETKAMVASAVKRSCPVNKGIRRCLAPISNETFELIIEDQRALTWSDLDQTRRPTIAWRLARGQDSLNMKPWNLYTQFLEQGLTLYKPVLHLYPKLSRAATDELAILRKEEAKEEKGCQAILAKGDQLEPPDEFFKDNCNETLLASAFLESYRKQYDSLYSSQQLRLKEEEEKHRQLEALQREQRRQMEKEKENSVACKIAQAQLDYCSYFRDQQYLRKERARVHQINDLSGTRDLAAERNIASRLLT